MSFAQVHYPFENAEWFEHHYPGDFIVEYIGQTRGWFYTMHVLAVALFDRHPFQNCICHGVVLDENAQKLSKRLRNYPSPEEVFATYGADALRWFLCSSPILRGADHRRDGVLAREEHGVDIHVHHARPALLGLFDYSSPAADAHIVVEAVEPPPAGYGVLDHGSALCGTGYVV
jgi:hypothetical protein